MFTFILGCVGFVAGVALSDIVNKDSDDKK